jgi:hypothetical protein
MPLPATCARSAWVNLSGAATAIVDPSPRPPLPPATEAITAISWFAPSSIVMFWPALKPIDPATGMTVAPAVVAVPTMVAPGVPTVAITAVSRFAPASMISV